MRLNRDEKEYAALGAKDLTSNHADIASLPLAQVGATTPLPLTQGINPAWAGAIAALQTHAIIPLLGARTVLTEADWNALVGKLAAFDAWNAGKTGGAVEKIGLARAREILATKAKETLTALIAKDKAEEGNSIAVIGLHRLIHYHRDHRQALPQLRQLRRFLWPEGQGHFPGGHAVSRPAQLRPVPHGG